MGRNSNAPGPGGRMMSRIISCKVIASRPAALVQAGSAGFHAASLNNLPAEPSLPAPVPVRRTLFDYWWPTVPGRPRYDARRDIPFGLVVDFLA